MVGFFTKLLGGGEYEEKQKNALSRFINRTFNSNCENLIALKSRADYFDHLKSLVDQELRKDSTDDAFYILTDWNKYYFSNGNTYPPLDRNRVISEISRELDRKVNEKIVKEGISVKKEIEVTGGSNGDWIHFPSKPIEDKKLFLNFIANLMAYTADDNFFVQFKKLNHAQLFDMFKATLDDYGYREQTIINESLVRCYSPGSVISISADNMNKFITDLKEVISKK